jgi:hypothetical protein
VFAQEHEKLLCFYPADWDPSKKMNLVGISEGLVNFTR